MPNDIDAALEELRRRHAPEPTPTIGGLSSDGVDEALNRIRRETGSPTQQENPEPITQLPAVKPPSREEMAVDSLDLSLRHASTSDAAAEAERRKLASKLGVDKQMLPDPETARQDLFLKENDAAELLRTNPEIAKYLEDLDNAAIAGPDVKNLKSVTNIMRQLVADPFVAAAKTTVAVPQTLAGVYKIYDRGVKSLMSLIPQEITTAVDNATPQSIRRAIGTIEDTVDVSLGGLVDFKQTQDFIEEFYSPRTLAAKAKVQGAEGFLDTLNTALANPSVIGTTVAESVGPMLLGGAAAQTIVKAFPALSPLIAGAAGEGVAIAGSTAQGMTEDTGEPLTGKQALLSIGAGTLGAGIGVLGGKIMQKMGVTDIDTALAKGSLEKALRDSKMPQSLIARVTAGGVGEGVLEEMPQSAIEQIAHNVGTGKPWDEGVENAMAMGLLAGAATGGVVQAFTPKAPAEGLNKDIDNAAVDALRDVGRAQQAADNRKNLEEFGKAVTSSELRKNSPEEFKKFVRTMSDEGQMIEEVYVDPKTLNEAFAQSEITPEEVAEKMPDLARELKVAEQTGTDVRISFDDYATYIAGSKAEPGIIDHLRTTPEGMTYSESQLFQQEQTKNLTEKARQIFEENEPVLTKAEFQQQNPQGDYKQYQQEHKNKREVFAVDTQQVHDDILSGLAATKRFTNDVNAVYAVPFREFYATAAAKEGVLPSDIYKRMPLNFKNVKIEDGLLDQMEPFGQEGENNPVTADEVSAFTESLTNELGIKTLFMFPDNRGNLKLETLIVDKSNRGRGVGTEAMERIVAYADEKGLRVALTPAIKDDFQGTTSSSRLVKFYKRFGFVENKGRNKDFSISESMYRPPQTLTQNQRAPIPEQLPETITVDGVERPTTNSEGKQIHPTREGVENFWRWFGDSKVVDEEGRPLVVYHGTTSEFDTFNGTFNGSFFSDNEDAASRYGETIPAYLSIKDAALIDAKGHFWNELDTVKSATLDALRKHTGKLFTVDHVKAAAKKAGNDGAIVLNVVDNDGANNQYVVFDPNQIKSVDNVGSFSPTDNNILNQTQLRTPNAHQESISNVNGRARTIAGLPPLPGFEQQTKIRGRDGRPLTVFRGSTQGLQDAHFEKAALGKASGKAPSGRGVHFTTNRGVANLHGDVREFQLDIRNPFTFKADDESIPSHDTAEEYFEWREGLRAKGFDGIVEIASHLGGPNTIIAFDPQQVIEKPGVFNQSPVLTDTIMVDGVERPTTNSEGKKIHPTVEGVQNFWRWFGDSKVVDEEGRPKVVYHGTANEFDAFDESQRGTNTQANGAERGFFFAGSKADANLYIEIAQGRARKDYQEEPTGRVIEAYLRAEKPLILTPFEEANVDEGTVEDLIDADPVALDYAVENGFDATVWPHGNMNNAAYTAVVFDPNQIKSIDNVGSFSPDDNSILNQSAFYSALEREIGGLKKVANKQGMVKPEQAIQWITARQKEGKFKQAEVDAIGILDWLSATKEPVSVSDVEQFVQQNGIQLEEVTLADTFDDEFLTLEDTHFFEQNDNGQWQVFGENASESDVFDTQSEAEDRLNEILGELRGQVDGVAEFGEHVLPGGENYREFLMTLPGREGKKPFRSSHFDQENIVAHVRFNEREADTPPTPEMLAEKAAYDATAEERRELEEQRRAVTAQINKEKGSIREKVRAEVLAEGVKPMRVDEEVENRLAEMPKTKTEIQRDEIQAKLNKLPSVPRWLIDGTPKQKVLFIEEIQSDWAQEGRKKGFQHPLLKQRLDKLREVIRARYPKMKNIEDRDWSIRKLLDAGVPKSIAYRYGSLASEDFNNVPRGPFLENTKDWTALAFKRMLRYAVDNGFDKIAWTTGEQQGERYDLSRTVEAIEYEKGRTGNLWKVRVFGKKDKWTELATPDQEELELIVGKKLAARIMADDGEKFTDIDGRDITYIGDLNERVGGEGMIAYYDNIVPQVVADIMKKLKGPKVSKSEIEEIGAQPSLDITPELAEKVMQGLPLFQDKTIQNRAAYDPTSFTISLLKGADLSSVIHEGGHFYLEALADMASQQNAVQQVKDDFRTTLSWFGINGPDPEGVWRLMTLDQKRQFHEQWAQSFERYALEGKAPTLEMQPVFARFRSWMLKVYKSMKEFLKQNPLAGKLNDDIRQVFDRILAAEEAIKEAEKAREYAPLFANANEAGATDKEFQEYMEQGQAATSTSVDELASRSLKDMQWLSGARDRAIKKLQRQANDKRKVIRQEVMDELLATPVHRAMTFLRSGKITKDDGTVETLKEHKLNSDDVRDIRPGMDLRALPGMTKPGGLDPDFAAQLFGFDSGDSLLTAILNEPKAAETIRDLTDKRMLEEHGDLIDPASIKKAADKAVHNKARARFTATGLAMLAKKVGAGLGKGAVNQINKAAKQAADSVIAEKKIRDIKPNQFTMAEKRANKEAIKFAGKQDNKRAFEAQRAALLNNKLFTASQKAQDEVDKALDYLKKFTSPGVRKKINIDHLEQIDDLLGAFDLRKGISNKKLDKRKSLQDWIDEQEANGFEPAIDPAVVDELKRKHYKDMTLDEMRGLVDTIRQIDHIGRRWKTLFTAKDKREFQARVDEADDSIRANANRTVKERGTPTDVVGLTGKWLRSMLAIHRKFNSIIREMDGSKNNGVMWNLLARGMNEAGDNETEMKQVAATKIAELFKNLPKGATVAGNLYAKKRNVPGTNLSMTHEQRIMFAMNWGNEGNRQRLLDGGITGRRALSIKEADAVLDTLTKEEWDFVQGVWDYIATYKNQVAALEKQITGITPKWVDPTPVKTKFGTYAGGYFPAKYDTELSSRSEALEALVDLRTGMKGLFGAAATRNGYAKARADKVINRPLLLSYNVISQHVSEVTHRLAWQPWLTDANRVLKALDAPIREHYGVEILKELRDTVEDIALGDAPAKNAAEQAINRLRKGSTIVGMGWRFTTALMQPTGIAQSWVRIGGKWALRGVGQYLANPNKAAKFVDTKSKFMKDRGITMQREINEVLNTIRAGEKVSVVTASYFSMIGKMQRTVDIPTWMGAYEKFLQELKYENATDDKSRKDIEDHAVALADQAVLDSQSGGQIKDLAKVQRGHPAWKLFTNFYSYYSAAYNLNIEAVRRTSFKSPSEVGLLAMDLIMINTVPVVMSTALMLLIKGGCDMDDIECLTKRLVQDQMSHFMGQMVPLREMSAALSAATGGDSYGYQGPAGLRFFNDVYKTGVQVQQGEADMALFKAGAHTAGAILHLPTGQVTATLEGIMAVERGDVEGVSILPALLAGPPRD